MYVVYTRIDAQCERELGQTPVEDWPPLYRDRLAGMRSADARLRTLAGLWLLGHGLRATGVDAACLARIGFSVDGRPEIAGGPAFSISHSETLVACAISGTAAVGLDVEARQPFRFARMARLMTAEEQRIVAAEPVRFYDFWCAREATVKATGRVGLARIKRLRLHADRAHLDGRDWPLRALALEPGYAAWLASDRPFDTVRTEYVAIGARA